jgi:hypothetical protein
MAWSKLLSAERSFQDGRDAALAGEVEMRGSWRKQVEDARLLRGSGFIIGRRSWTERS